MNTTKKNNTKTQRLAITDTEQDETGTPNAISKKVLAQRDLRKVPQNSA